MPLNDSDFALLLHYVELGFYAEFEFKVSKAVTRCGSSGDKSDLCRRFTLTGEKEMKIMALNLGSDIKSRSCQDRGKVIGT